MISIIVYIFFLFFGGSACLVPMDLVGNGCARRRSVQQPWQYLGRLESEERTKDVHPIPLQLDTASSRTLSQRQGVAGALTQQHSAATGYSIQLGQHD